MKNVLEAMVCFEGGVELNPLAVETILLQKLAKSISLAHYPVLGLQVFAAVYRSRLRLINRNW